MGSLHRSVGPLVFENPPGFVEGLARAFEVGGEAPGTPERRPCRGPQIRDPIRADHRGIEPLGHSNREVDDVDSFGRVGADVPAARFEEPLVEAVGVHMSSASTRASRAGGGEVRGPPTAPNPGASRWRAALPARPRRPGPGRDRLVGLPLLRGTARLRGHPACQLGAWLAGGTGR